MQAQYALLDALTKYVSTCVSRTSLGSVQTGQGNIRFLPLSAIENPFATWKYARCPLSLYIVGPVF